LKTVSAENEHEDAIREVRGDLRPLCRIGGIAALLLIVYSLAMLVQVVALGGQPTSAAQAFDLLAHHRLVGLLRLDLPTIAVMPLYYLLFLGLFAALRKSDLAITVLSTVLAFAGLTLVMATPTALSMLPLSDKFSAATSDAVRNQLLAAGEAIMAADIWHATGAIVGGVLFQCGAVLISVVMLRGGVFSKTTGWLGIVMHGLDLAHIVSGLFLPISGFVLLAIAGPLYPIWFFLVGRRLLQLAKQKPEADQRGQNESASPHAISSRVG
jgi:hypothetical protein